MLCLIYLLLQPQLIHLIFASPKHGPNWYKKQSAFGLQVGSDLICRCLVCPAGCPDRLVCWMWELASRGSSWGLLCSQGVFKPFFNEFSTLISHRPDSLSLIFFLPLQGISQAAGYIYKKLVNDGILNQALSIVPVGVKIFNCMRCGCAMLFFSIARMKVFVLMHSVAMGFNVSLQKGENTNMFFVAVVVS